MKLPPATLLLCLFVTTAGIVVSSQGLYAQTIDGDSWLSVPREAVIPLGQLMIDNPALFDVSAVVGGARVDTMSAGLASKVAPGELFPISVKLTNFGGGARVDVLVNYGIYSSSGNEIYSTTETVAVETTASFVKTLQIPFDAVPGTYTAQTSITYRGQLVPAGAQFPFTVESKIGGLYRSDFITYGGITLLLAILVALLCYALIKRHNRVRYVPFDYTNIPRAQRTFYEIISDTIMQMRGRVGDEALIIASHIEGLKIDVETGRVLAVTDRPAKIIASLVSEYEKLLGKKVSFSFREGKEHL